MRMLLSFAILLLAHAAPAATQFVQVQIEARYEKIDPAFTKDVVDKPVKDYSMPRVIVKSDHEAVVRVIREFTKEVGWKKDASPSAGATITITPSIRGNDVHVTGCSVLSRKNGETGSDSLKTVGFSKLETFFEGTVPDGGELVLPLGQHDEGRLILKLSLQDAEGRPVK